MTETHTGSPLFLRGAELPWEEMAPGLRRQVLGYDRELMMVHVRFDAGATAALHHHPHRQAGYVVSGRFQVEIGGETQVLGPGDAFFAPPGVEHGVVALEEGEIVDVFAPARQDFLPRDGR